MSFKRISIESLIFPVPTEKIQNPKPTELNVGDFVKAKIGPAKGKIGIVVVERNGNYEDYVDEINQESIGVGFAEHDELDPVLESALAGLTGTVDNIISTVGWFDSVKQLELLASAGE